MSGTVPHPAPLRVLIVVDDGRSGRKLGDLLRRDGLEVEVCAGGHAGMQRLTDRPIPDVLVTDLRTPQIDGITLTRLARTHSPTMPILIVTAYPDLAHRFEGTDPMTQIFVKPLDYSTFVAALRALPRST